MHVHTETHTSTHITIYEDIHTCIKAYTYGNTQIQIQREMGTHKYIYTEVYV